MEYTASAGGAAFVIGKENLIAEILDTYSYTTDTPDFWRRQHADYPSHGGRFTGKPAYFKHVISATQALLQKTGTKISDYDYVVFHQPNGKFPLEAARKLDVPLEKVKTGLLTPMVGNTYSGASPLGLTAVLDEAKPGARILMTSFGSGAGSDSFAITVTDRIDAIRDKAPSTKDYMAKKKYIDYATYIKFRKKLRM